MAEDKAINSNIFRRFIIWSANALFGWRRYRVTFTYKDPAGRVVFHIATTVGVDDAYYINESRELKREFGPLHNIDQIRARLCNGTLEVEPTCYLGRWKTQD